MLNLEEIANKIKFHRKQARNSLNWYNLLNLVFVVVACVQPLSMTLMLSFNCTNAAISICGSCFSVVIILVNRIVLSFQFNVLNVQHHQIADDLQEIINLYETEDSNYLNRRYLSIIEKSHIQEIRDCPLFFCCF